MPRKPLTDRADRRRTGASRAAQGLLTAALAVGAVVTTPGGAGAVAVPPTPSGLPAGVEALQPYVGQQGCDPVAKPGVRAFSSMLLNTYRDTRSLGIVRDCGIGGSSEHKEGRAFDWGVSAYNASHVAEVDAVKEWLLASNGTVRAARARRLGIMYMIWNRKIWKAYQIDRGWQDYSGPSPHTDHVHFSFGWNGARQHTSWWTKVVAPIEYGPYAPAPSTPTPPPPAPSVTPVRSPENLKIVATYGGLALRSGSTGTAVKVVQTGLKITADGDYGSNTVAAVKAFQTSRGLAGTGVFGSAEWQALFPRPIQPFGRFESVTATAVRGWAADADTTSPINVKVTVDGAVVKTAAAALPRPELATAYPTVGTAHGYDIPVRIPAGTHRVCVVGVNLGAGSDTSTGCASITVTASPMTATSRSEGVVHVFQRGPAGNVERLRYDAGTLSAPQAIAGQITGAPAPVWRSSTLQEVLVRGTDNALQVTQRVAGGGDYSPLKSIGGAPVTSRPAVSARGTTGRVDLVVRGEGGSLVHRVSRKAGSWTAGTDLGGKILAGTAPALAWTPSGRLDAVVVGNDQQLWRKSMSSTGSWSSWEALGGVTTSDITAVATSTTGVSIAVRGTDGKGYVRSVAKEVGSGRWTSLGGVLASAPAIANAPGSAVTEVFATGTNGAVYRNTRTSGSWSGWVRES